MIRTSRRAFSSHPWSLIPLFIFFLFILASPSFAQRGASMGHAGGGPHFARAASMSAAPLAPRSAHIPYQRSARRGTRTFSRGAAHNYSSFITYRRPLAPRSAFFFNSRFRRYPFLPYAYGFWPWWGWDSDTGDECNPYYSDCGPGSYVQNAQPGSYIEPDSDTGPSSYVSSYNDTPRPMITIYLRDGSGYGALDYWVSNGVLHIATTYGVQKSFPMEDVDLVRTGKENALNGINFTFGNAPMISDPGPVLAPDSYAPPCPANYSATHASSAAAPNAQANFGATGNPSEKGFAVTSVRANSPAAQAGLQAGDVVVRVDCQPIRNSQDLETAFSGPNSTLWVSYLIQGSWLTDKKISR